jgi:hypothetical protein
MPADRKEQIRQLPSGRFQLRYYDRQGVRHSGGVFPSKSAARAHYRAVIEPELTGKPRTQSGSLLKTAPLDSPGVFEDLKVPEGLFTRRARGWPDEW